MNLENNTITIHFFDKDGHELTTNVSEIPINALLESARLWSFGAPETIAGVSIRLNNVEKSK